MQSPASYKPSGCTHLKRQSGSPKIGMQGLSLSRESRNLVYFGRLVAGREGSSFSNQNHKQSNCWARRRLKVTPGLMAGLSSKCASSLASPNVKPRNSPGLCAEPNVDTGIAQPHPSAVQRAWALRAALGMTVTGSAAHLQALRVRVSSVE